MKALHPSLQNIIEVLSARSHDEPGHTGFVYLEDGETRESRVTWLELWQRTQAIAGDLTRRGLKKQCVLLMYPPGVDFIAAFFGCLAAGVIAVPVYPARPNRSLAKIHSIIDDCRPAAALSTTASRGQMARIPDAKLRQLVWITTDGGPDSPSPPVDVPISSMDLAFLQYTSGSTGDPKGVMVNHANLMHNEALIRNAFSMSRESVIVSWLPLYHDMGLIGSVLQTVYSGATAILISPLAFLQKPIRWLRAISCYRATTSGGPNFAYDLCARKISDADAAELDLSTWSVAYNGSEPVRHETMARFGEKFAGRGFRREAFLPCYGLAEATLFVSGGAPGKGARLRPVESSALEAGIAADPENGGRRHVIASCGKPSADQRVSIVDPDLLSLRPPGHIGEIWLTGESITRGYWGRPRQSEETYGAQIAGGDGTRFLRTGDLGFIEDDELYITGRRKDLIIIRGRNHYPQDIEATVEQCHAGFRVAGCAALAVDMDGEEQLVIIQEVDAHCGFNAGEAIDAILQAVTQEHEVQAGMIALVSPGSVLKTSSGKIRRQDCKRALMRRQLKLVAEWHSDSRDRADKSAATPASLDSDGAEEWLAAEVAQVLGVELSRLDVNRSLAHYGIDSLRMVELHTRLEGVTGLALPLTMVGPEATISRLASDLESALARGEKVGRSTPVGAESDSTAIPLTAGQRALWFLHNLVPENAAYNIVRAFRARNIAPAALAEALRELSFRHEALRAHFHENASGPCQVIGDAPLTMECEDGSHWSGAELRAKLADEARRPFDLENGPLLRLHLIAIHDGSSVVFLAAHHIISDLWTLEIVFDELMTLYSAALNRGSVASLPPITLQYGQYSRWQQSMLEGPEGGRLAQFWETELAGSPGPLDLPADRLRPRLRTLSGSSCHFRIDPSVADAARKLASASNVTLYTSLLANFQVLLYRYTGQGDILVGSPTSCRIRPGLSELVGYLVNPVVMRTRLGNQLSFRELLVILQPKVLAALSHQEYPFPLVAERLQAKSGAGRSPVFDVMFVWHTPHRLAENSAALLLGHEGARILSGGLEMESIAVPHSSSQFDLTLAMTDDGTSLLATLEYSTDLFDSDRMQRMAAHFESLLACAARNPDDLVSELSLLTVAERDQLVAGFNRTRRDYGESECLQAGFERQAAQRPEAVALVWEGRQVRYGELNTAANRLARVLQKRGVGVEDRVGVCLERSIEMVVSLLAVLKAGGAYVPLEPGYPAERLEMMASADRRMNVAVTVRRHAARLPNRLTVLVLDETGDELESQSGNAFASGVDPESLAYVIYTSGSTGQPKGVMITHCGIVNRLRWGQEVFALNAEDVVLQKTPYSFDVSVWEFFWPLSTGARLAVARAGGHQDPMYLGELIERERITTAHFVPSMLRVFMEEETAVARCGSLKRVLCSGEALEPDLVKRFYERLGGVELHNLYGPTEASVEVTAWACERNADVSLIGRPIANMRTYVLDQTGIAAPIGIAGELCLGGVGLARGYVAQAGLTAEQFVPDYWSGDTGGRLYRTGDRARYRADGNIEYLGRLDSQMKIRGFRIEPGEIEAVMAGHPAAQQAAVLAQEDGAGGRRLVGYVVLKEEEKSFETAQLRKYLKNKLPEYMVPSVIIRLEQLPLNSNGKLDRKALPVAAMPEAHPSRLPRNAIEEIMAQIWGDLLRLESVGVDENFFELGGHSLLATQSMTRANSIFGTSLPLRLFLETPTIIEQSRAIEMELSRGAGRRTPPIVRRSYEEDAPLSYPQRRLWFLHQLDPESAAYNVPGALRFNGGLNIPVLAESIDTIVRRHDVLRTSFIERNGVPVQVVDAVAGVPFQISDLRGFGQPRCHIETTRLMSAEAEQPFDLRRGPLLRIRLLQLTPEDHILLVTMHHIISDYWSLGIFVTELATLYQSFSKGLESPLRELPVQYRDFALWQREFLNSETMAAQSAYWKRQLAGILPVIDIPADHARPLTQTTRGAVCEAHVPPDLLAALRKLGRAESATLFMALLAAFNVLLHRHTGQSDLIVGSPVANRNHATVENLIGFFANTLVLRVDSSGNPRFADFLRQVRTVALNAYANQDLPFERLVEELQPERDTSRSPLFQVAFALQNAPFPTLEFPGLHLEIADNPTSTAKFDLTLIAAETGPALRLLLEYRTDLFEEFRIQRMLGHFETLLHSIVRTPGAPLSVLGYMRQQELDQVLHDWNRTEKKFRRGLTVQQLIEEQVERTPGAVALVYEKRQLNYLEFNRCANTLARLLRNRGVGPEVRVGLLMERSLEMAISIAAILKAGGAYVPLEPSYPEERLRFMIEDAETTIILTQHHLLARVPSGTGIVVNSEGLLAGPYPVENPPPSADEDNMAYLIYTSGSTGNPKGAMISHAAICNRLLWMQDAYALRGDDSVLQKTPFSFDVSVWEFLWPLMTGARLVVAKPGAHQDPAAIAELIVSEEITTVHFVPSMLQVFLDEPALPQCNSLKRIICSGEALSPALRDKCIGRSAAELHNLYGPTEAAVDVTCFDCRAEEIETTVPIGRPIANIQIHLVDEYWQPVAAGVRGELCIGGIGLARGYLGRPDLTAERFTPDAFSGQAGDRLYRTGDVARYREDGVIEYLGRADDQVKVRGFRIEPGEIEKAIAGHDAVQECVVIARDDGAAGRRLLAYVVPHHENAFTVNRQLQIEEEDGAAEFRELPNGMTVAHLNKGETDFTYSEIFEHQVYAQNGITLQKGDCVFDVGANIGLFTLLIGHSVTNHRIYAFEPVPSIFNCLRSNVRLYGLNARLFQCGIGRKAGTETFTYYPGMSIISGRFADPVRDRETLRSYIRNQPPDSATAGVSKSDVDEVLEARLATEEVRVPMRTLSDIIREHAIERIDLLKIDVEGGELEVLEGIAEEDWPKIRQLVAEVHDIDGRLDLVRQILTQRGYRITTRQDMSLRQTCLFNIFAIHPLRTAEISVSGTDDDIEPARKKWTSTVRLIDDLKDHLRYSLPEYMVPAAFVPLRTMPLTVNGKVDRRALLARREDRQITEPYVAPRTPLEEKLAIIWTKILHRDNIGIHDNFFSLGGHSLLIPRLAHEISTGFGIDLPLFRIFQRPTIAALADAFIEEPQKIIAPMTVVPSERLDISNLLDNFEKLPDDQVKTLLESLLHEQRGSSKTERM